MDQLYTKGLALIRELKAAGAKDALFVGGCVRDKILDIPCKDIDIEVYGMGYAQIQQTLSGHDVRPVGESFGILRVDGQFDVSVPRRESKIGKGHRGFLVEPDPSMSVEEAAARRDYTINSMAMTEEWVIIDHYNGQRDLASKILRATSPAFSEDALRVLRGMQFMARFDLTEDPKTILMCRDLRSEFSTLAHERICEEWMKWATKSKIPSKGLAFLVHTGWCELFPHLHRLLFTPQDSVWHPEGNALFHTWHVCDSAKEIATREGLDDEQTAVLMFSALTHDLGKITTTELNSEGRWATPGHDAAGVPLAKDLLKAIGLGDGIIDQVLPQVREHMAHIRVEPSPRTLRRLAARLTPSNIKMWGCVVEADHSGRPPLPKGNPVAEWLQKAEEVKVVDSRPKQILLGRHLLPLGFKPGPELGSLLRRAYEAQLDGVFSDLEGGIEWVHTQRC